MSFIIREKWIWIIIGICVLILVAPYAVVWMIMQMPDALRAFAVWILIFSWGIAGGYKDWLMDKRKREGKSGLPQ